MTTKGRLYFILVTDVTTYDEAMWWRHNRAGYTLDLDRAGRYTEEEWLKAVPSDKRKTNVLVPVEDVEAVAHRVVDRDDAAKVLATINDREAAEALRSVMPVG